MRNFVRSFKTGIIVGLPAVFIYFVGYKDAVRDEKAKKNEKENTQ